MSRGLTSVAPIVEIKQFLGPCCGVCWNEVGIPIPIDAKILIGDVEFRATRSNGCD